MLVTLPSSFFDAFDACGTTIAKPGGRFETPLCLDNAVMSVADQLNILKPLRFASLVEARPSEGESQAFHVDSHSSERTTAIVYLSDVPDVSYGPVELESTGPVLGPRGTAVVYNNVMHRGVVNRSEKTRMALALAFDESDVPIKTIGEVSPEPSAQIVGDSQHMLVWFIGIVVALFLIYAFLNNANRSK
jgi:hypothetical protein